MSIQQISSYAAGSWIAPGAGARDIASAITGEVIASAGNSALDVQAMLDHARTVGGPTLRAMTFHDRARMLKALATHLMENKQALYDLSFNTGATQSDHMIDIDGGIGTMFVFASKGRRDMPDGHVYLDGEVEQLGRTGSFLANMFAPRCRAWPCISTPLTSRSGGCWKSWHPPCWAGCLPSSSRPPTAVMLPNWRCG